MKSNVIRFGTPAAAEQPEPLESAVRELSERVAENNAERRLLFSRLDELRGLSPERRRRRPRSCAPPLPRPVTFYSIEEADASEASARPQVA